MLLPLPINCVGIDKWLDYVALFRKLTVFNLMLSLPLWPVMSRLRTIKPVVMRALLHWECDEVAIHSIDYFVQCAVSVTYEYILA